MTHTIGNITFGAIKNVRKYTAEEGVYFADVEIAEAEGFPFETHAYVARSDDYAVTGKWVYQQIMDGNFEGEMTEEHPTNDIPVPQLPISGAQTL